MALRVTHRSLVLLILALFSLGTVGHAFAAAQMQAGGAKIAVSEGMLSHGDCDGCGSNRMSASDAACQAVCTTPTILGAGLPTVDTAGMRPQATPSVSPLGRSGPPDPYPPRAGVLS